MKTRKVLVVEGRTAPENPLRPLYLPDEAEVAMAFNACHALQILETEKDFDLIVCNVILAGGQNGIQLVQKIEEERICCIPVIFLAPFNDLLLEAKNKNFSCYAGSAKKPVMRELFTEMMEEILDKERN